jgi:diguanylate cyclase (GGDEF)-like protein
MSADTVEMSGDSGLPTSGWFDLIARNSGLNFFVLRVAPDMAFEFVSSAVTPSLGIEVPGKTAADAAAVLSRIAVEHADRLAEILALPPGQQKSLDLNWQHLDGRPVFSRAVVQSQRRPDGSVILEGVVQDITELRQLEAELTRLATTDPVTGVWNRHHGRDLLVAEASADDRERRHRSVLMVDIDNFKSINDRFGHQTGDQVLIELARRLAESVRGTDMVTRWGGEEFVILLRDCPLEEAQVRAEEIRRKIAGTSFPRVGRVTVCVGAAQLGADDELASWLDRADGALYAAKSSGRDTVVAFK